MSKHANMMPFRTRPASREIPVDLTQAIAKSCECGCPVFAKVYRIKIVSNLAPGNTTGQDIPVEISTYLCAKCGKELGAEEKEEAGEEGEEENDTH